PFILPRQAGKGDRPAQQGGGRGAARTTRAKKTATQRAPSTALRAVPLPRSVSLRGGGSHLHCEEQSDEAIHLPAKAALWIASLALAMTSVLATRLRPSFA